MTDQEIDKTLAEKVMGWNVNYIEPGFRENRVHWRDNENSTIYLPDQWNPSACDALAMEVVDKIVSKWGVTASISGCAHAPDDGVLWSVSFSDMEGLDATADSYSRNHAICAAALETVGVKIKV